MFGPVFAGNEAERQLLHSCAWALVVMSITVFPILFFLKAPYGRYASDARSPLWGPPVNVRAAWVIQECPTLVFTALSLYHGDPKCLSSLPNLILLSLFAVHYVNRTLIYPFKIRGGNSTPLLVVFFAWLFCTINGYLQARTLTYLFAYDLSWLYDVRFIVGVITFAAGMYWNIQADAILRSLRSDGKAIGKKRYSIPHGGLFEYVSGANFSGEIIEWFGFAIATWSFAGFAFAFASFANTAPRGYQHHLNYLEMFGKEYPKNRKAVIPFIW